MSRTTIAACVATIAIGVPAGWHLLDADIPTNGKLLRPLQQSVDLGNGVRITLDVDRSVITSGDTVVATLRAYSDTPKRVAVDLSVYASEENEGSRMGNPASEIDREPYMLSAAPGGGPAVQSALVLGSRGSARARMEAFRIYASARGVKPVVDTWGSVEDTAIPSVAAVGVIGWSGDSLSMTVAPDGPVRADAPFIVAVRVKNPSRKAVPLPFVRLGTQIGPYGSIGDGDIDVQAVDDNDNGEPQKLRAGETMIAKFKVTPKSAPPSNAFTFVASASAIERDGTEWKRVAGAMDVRRFAVSRDPARTVTRGPTAPTAAPTLASKR